MATTKKATKKVAAKKSTKTSTSTKKSPSARAVPAPKKTPAKKPSTAARKPYPDNDPDNTKPPRSRPADAVDLLADDHLAVDKLFKRYEKMATKKASGSERQALAGKICKMLKVHTAIEEEVFYPAAREAGIESDLMDEANVEHATAKDLIRQIESSNPQADYYDAKVKVLGDYITHHVVEEHTEMFPKCRRSKMDLSALAQQLAARKKELEASGAPAQDPPGLLSRIGSAVSGGRS